NPMVWCEIIREWSTFHPEFAFLPRKFKIAVSGAVTDRAAVGVHDIGLQAIEQDGEIGFRVWVGGGLGRTPIVGQLINPFVPWQHLLTYLQAAVRVYNRYGRRDNKFKAPIKILVKDLTPQVYAEKVAEEWVHLKNGPDTLTREWVEATASRFTQPVYEANPAPDNTAAEAAADPRFAQWLRRNTH